MLTINIEKREAFLKGKELHVPNKQWEVLVLLAKADGRVLSKEAILEKVWGIDGAMEVTTMTVNQHICRLRRLLKPFGTQIIVNINRAGYKAKFIKVVKS